jgi:hypothetical protein
MLVGRSQEPESRSQEAAGGYMTSIAAGARSPVAATVPLYPGSSETEAFARRHTFALTQRAVAINARMATAR